LEIVGNVLLPLQRGMLCASAANWFESPQEGWSAADKLANIDARALRLADFLG
jgi:hypothetical protein